MVACELDFLPRRSDRVSRVSRRPRTTIARVSVPWSSVAAIAPAFMLATLSARAQAWVTFNWIGWADDHGHYPEECLSSWLPTAYASAEYLWILTATAGVVAVTAAGLLHRPRVDIATLGGAWAAAFISYCLTPMVQAAPGRPILDWRPIEANPFRGNPSSCCSDSSPAGPDSGHVSGLSGGAAH